MIGMPKVLLLVLFSSSSFAGVQWEEEQGDVASDTPKGSDERDSSDMPPGREEHVDEPSSFNFGYNRFELYLPADDAFETDFTPTFDHPTVLISHFQDKVLHFAFGVKCGRNSDVTEAQNPMAHDFDEAAGWLEVTWPFECKARFRVKGATDRRFSKCVDLTWDTVKEAAGSGSVKYAWQCLRLGSSGYYAHPLTVYPADSQHPIGPGWAGGGYPERTWNETSAARGIGVLADEPTIVYYTSNGLSITIDSGMYTKLNEDHTELCMIARYNRRRRFTWSVCAQPHLRGALRDTWDTSGSSGIAERLSNLAIKDRPQHRTFHEGPVFVPPQNEADDVVKYARRLSEIIRDAPETAAVSGNGTETTGFLGAILIREGSAHTQSQKELEALGFALFAELRIRIENASGEAQWTETVKTSHVPHVLTADSVKAATKPAAPSTSMLRWVKKANSNRSSTMHPILVRLTPPPLPAHNPHTKETPLLRLVSAMMALSVTGSTSGIMPALTTGWREEEDREAVIRYLQVASLLGTTFEVPPFVTATDDRTVWKALLRCLALRKRLSPYYRSARLRNEPAARPMYWAEGSEDGHEMQKCGIGPFEQFMLGDHVVVAPMLAMELSRKVYIPKGYWIDLSKEGVHEIRRGPSCIQYYPVSILQVPLFERRQQLTEAEHLEL